MPMLSLVSIVVSKEGLYRSEADIHLSEGTQGTENPVSKQQKLPSTFSPLVRGYMCGEKPLDKEEFACKLIL
jgi:hypothetical protein